MTPETTSPPRPVAGPRAGAPGCRYPGPLAIRPTAPASGLGGGVGPAARAAALQENLDISGSVALKILQDFGGSACRTSPDSCGMSAARVRQQRGTGAAWGWPVPGLAGPVPPGSPGRGPGLTAPEHPAASDATGLAEIDTRSPIR